MSNNELDLVAEAERRADDLKSSLVPKFELASLSHVSKIPFKAISWGIALTYRASELADTSIDLYHSQRFVSASMATRSLMETAAMLYWLHHRLKTVVDSGELGDIDEFLMRGSLGHRNRNDLPEALNALTGIDRVAKQYEGFRDMYDDLSEFAHPNWSGTIGAFGVEDQESMRVEFDNNPRGLPWDFIFRPLIISLMVTRRKTEEVKALVPRFIKICDEDLGHKAI